MNRRRLLQRSTILLGGSLLTACQALELSQRSAPQLYQLSPKSTLPEGMQVVENTIILVEPPTATAGLSNARIALRPDATVLEYYASVLWVDVLPLMIQSLIVETMDAASGLDALLPSEASGIRTQYILRTHIREFQAEYAGDTSKPPAINARIEARLLRLPRRESVAQFDEKRVIQSQENNLDNIVLAFDDALGKILKSITLWAVESLNEQNLIEDEPER